MTVATGMTGKSELRLNHVAVHQQDGDGQWRQTLGGGSIVGCMSKGKLVDLQVVAYCWGPRKPRG